MLKKFLMAVGVLAIIAVVAMVVIFNKFDSAIQEKVPEFRQYVTMTTEDQNTYVEKNIDNFLMQFGFVGDTAEEKADYQEIKNNPEIRAALIDLGRSMVATLIVSSEVYNELDNETKAKIKTESDQRNMRHAKLNDVLKKYESTQK